MASPFLSRLSQADRAGLVQRLHALQKGHCFICEQGIDLVAQQASLDIDHVIPLSVGGKDDDSNFALAHQSCNRSKQAANLEVARVLSRFSRLRDQLAVENRSPSLGDVLKQANGGQYELGFRLQGDEVVYSLAELGDPALRRVPVYRDTLSGFRYFFAELPIEYFLNP